MRITPIVNRQFVADIDDIDLLTLSESEFEEIYQAWLHYGVLRFRNQALDDHALQQFSARFGPLEEMPLRPHVATRAQKNSQHLRHGSVQYKS